MSFCVPIFCPGYQNNATGSTCARREKGGDEEEKNRGEKEYYYQYYINYIVPIETELSYCTGSGRGRRKSAMWPHQTTAELCTLLQSGLLKDELPADQPRHQECLVDHEKNDGFKYLGWLVS